jgi:D-alanine-D-alanine ligase
MGTTPRTDQPPLLRVGVTYNLKSTAISNIHDDEAEYDDYGTILAIKDALEANNCQVVLFEVSEELPLRLANHKLDIVFNIAEGTKGRGREAQVPAILNFFRIPFTGSDETTLCIALDKALTKRILATYHIKTNKYNVIRKETPVLPGKFVFPAIVKPNAEGSSKGISSLSLASDMNELHHLIEKNLDYYQQDMLVEEYIEGREFTIGIIGNGKDIRVFPPMEIIYKNRKNKYNIYSYDGECSQEGL